MFGLVRPVKLNLGETEMLQFFVTHLSLLAPWTAWYCRRHPEAAENVDGSGDKAVAKPTATRHIFLIRHGQYVLDGKSDEHRILTELGNVL